MSDIKITPMHGGGAPARDSRTSRSSPQYKLNNTLAIALCVIVAVAPLPLGSNRPLAWTFWAALVGICAVIYAFRLGMLDQPFRYGLESLRLETAMVLTVVAYLAIQIIPLGRFSITTVDGGIIAVTPQISVAPGATILMLLRFITYSVFFFLMLQVCLNARRRARILNALMIVTVAYALYGLVSLLQFGDTILGVPKWGYLGSATGPFVNRNSFATFLAFGAAITAARLASRATKTGDARRSRLFESSSLLLVLSLAILLATVILTNSRMGAAVWLSACITVSMCLFGKMGRGSGLIFLAVPLVIAVFAAFMVFYGDGLFDRLGNTGNNAMTRFAMYEQILTLIEQRPLLGFGGGSFEWAYQLAHAAPVNLDLRWDRAHNTYLGLWLELGIPAGTVVMALISLIGVKVTRAMAGDADNWAAQAACLGVIVAGSLHSLVDFSLEIQANTFLFLAVCAAGLAASFAQTQRVPKA